MTRAEQERRAARRKTKSPFNPAAIKRTRAAAMKLVAMLIPLGEWPPPGTIRCGEGRLAHWALTHSGDRFA